MAVVRQPQRLVVHPAVHVALQFEEAVHVVGAEARPVVTREHRVGVVAPHPHRLVDVLRPGERVADLRTADRIQVVQRVGAVLRHAQQPLVGEEEVHLRRCLRVGCVLEDDAHAVDVEFGARLADRLGGCDEARRAERDRLSEPGVDLTERSERQQRTELVHRAAAHDRPRQHVLADRLVHEPLGCDHPDVAVRDGLPGRDPEHPAEVIEVAVRVDHRTHGPLAEVLVREVEACPSALLGGQRVDDQPTAVGLDERDVGDVVPPGLPHPVSDLEQAVVGVQLALAPQTWVNGVGRGVVVAEEVVVCRVPHGPAVLLDATGRMLRDESPVAAAAKSTPSSKSINRLPRCDAP